MKFTFIRGGKTTDIYEVSKKDDLVNNFTPDAFKELVQVPDGAKPNQLFDGTNLTDNIPADDRTDAEKARDIELAKPETILKNETDYFDKVIAPNYPAPLKDDTDAIAKLKASYLEPYQIS
tara:strand:- start:69 stop:431 length:363 start_codon:yes stop_codon:yes gene_type:complete